MFLPVFVHPGKRGPSPVKKAPKNRRQRVDHPRHPQPGPPTTSITVSLRPGQSNACLSLHSLSLHVKKISTSSRYGSSNRSLARPRARRLFFTRVRECAKLAYTGGRDGEREKKRETALVHPPAHASMSVAPM